MVLPLIDDLGSFIGVPALQDFSPVVDPSTDIGASGYNNCFADVAEMTHTVVRAFAAIKLSSSPILVQHDAVWGSSVAVAPTITHDGTGIFSINWPANVQDVLGNTAQVNLRQVCGTNIQSTTLFVCNATIASATTVQVRVYNSSLVASDATVNQTLVVSVL